MQAIWVSVPITQLPLHHKRNHRQYLNECMWLCPNKKLIYKNRQLAGLGPHAWSSSNPEIKTRIIFILENKMQCITKKVHQLYWYYWQKKLQPFINFIQVKEQKNTNSPLKILLLPSTLIRRENLLLSSLMSKQEYILVGRQ